MKGTAQPNIVIRVPRYGTVPAPPEVIEAAKKLSEKSGIPLKPNETIDPHSNVGESVDNASEWNSMLITARAGRGPQWDVASQLFQVDKNSDVYYDHGVLVAGDPDANNEDQQLPSQGHTPSGSGFPSPPPSFRRTPSQGGDFLNGTGPATPSPLPSRIDMPPPSTRRVTRGASGRGDSVH
ncbi:hypothetical protein FS837_011278 [Tulasnella sp. UAMH 9824]|nr:hypothetical protein FS837_011278 [Tulasnella sp. UAMH 9824]